MNSIVPVERQLTIPALALQVRVLEAGTGPVVLMLHGNPDNADEWRPLMERLAPKFRCIAPDFPGYGESPEPPPSFTYGLADLVRFVDGVLERTQARGPITLVVHDTGGMAGTAWAARNVPRLAGIVVTNTVAFEGFQWFDIARTWAARSTLGRLRAALGMQAIGWFRGALFKRLFGAQSPQLGTAELDRFARSFACNPVAKRVSLLQFRQALAPGFFNGFDAMWVRLSRDVPCRVLWGGQDPYISAQYAYRFGSAQVTVLPDVGHWVALVAPGRLAEEVARLSAVSTAGAGFDGVNSP
jgi:pimeloyl-ACP methyl ester carboxylesterase